MLKTLAAAALLTLGCHTAAFAACTMEDATNKSSAISEAVMPKLESKGEAASRILTEMGEALGSGTVTAATCARLDVLLERAKKL